MKKKRILLALVFFCAALTVSAVAPTITIVAPSSTSGEDEWYMGMTLHIRWTHSTFYTNASQTCRILCGGNIISPPVPVISKDFSWTVGKKHDGTYLAPGSYMITLENVNYSDLNGPIILIPTYAAPKITTTFPVNGTSLTIGSSYTIRWTHSSYFDHYPQDLIVVCGPAGYIGTVPATSDQFLWQVGKLDDATSIAPGNYKINYECSDYFSYDGPSISLVSLMSPKFHLLKSKIWIDKIPDCPMCFTLNPAQIKFDGEGPLIFDVELLRNGVLLAKLGRFGERRAAPGPVKIVLEQEPRSGMIRRMQPKYELRFLSTKGEVLHKEAIELEIAK